MLYIVGLGPGDPGLISRRGFELLTQEKTQVVFRTGEHPVAGLLTERALPFETYDGLYASLPDFEQVYGAIVADIARRCFLGDVVYAVPGNPMVAESTVQKLLALGSERGFAVEVVVAPSSLDAVYTVLGLDPTRGLAIADALDLRVGVDPDLPWLFTQVHSRLVAGELKLRLLDTYPPEHMVAVVRNAGGIAGQVYNMQLAELDHREFTSADTLFVPTCLEARHVGRAMEELRQLMSRLRGEGGCPWDREQTHQSLRPYLIEEAYEVLSAIEGDDRGELAKELGDLLLQVVFHAQIAKENGDFDLFDSISEITAKLIRRHPHVFGDFKVSSAHQVEENWRRIKQDEGGGHTTAPLDSVPMNLPALQLAYKLQAKAGYAGLDWPNVAGPFAKVDEEIAELKLAMDDGNEILIEKELGDLLFSIVNVSRFLKVEPETALRGAVNKFRRRCTEVMHLAETRGLTTSECSLDELDKLWEEVKSKESFRTGICVAGE